MAEKQEDQSRPSTTHPTPLTETGTPPTNQNPSSGTALYQSPPSTTHPTPLTETGTPPPPTNQTLSSSGTETTHPSHGGRIHQHHSSSAWLCITGQQKRTLKLIEKRSNELHEEESRLAKDGNQVVFLLASMLLLYMLVFGASIVINRGSIVAHITSNENENTLIIMVVATVFTYVVGMGMPIFLAFQNVQRLSWKNTIVQRQRGNLKAESEEFRRELNIVYIGFEVGGSSGVINISVDNSRVTLESANTRINACIESLGSDYFYHGHMFYVISIGVIGAFFLGIIVTLQVFSYIDHKDSDLAVKLGQSSFSSLI